MVLLDLKTYTFKFIDDTQQIIDFEIKINKNLIKDYLNLYNVYIVEKNEYNIPANNASKNPFRAGNNIGDSGSDRRTNPINKEFRWELKEFDFGVSTVPVPQPTTTRGLAIPYTHPANLKYDNPTNFDNTLIPKNIENNDDINISLVGVFFGPNIIRNVLAMTQYPGTHFDANSIPPRIPCYFDIGTDRRCNKNISSGRDSKLNSNIILAPVFKYQNKYNNITFNFIF